MDLSEGPRSLLHFLCGKRRAVMKGLLQPDLPIKTEITLYDLVMLQLEREIAHNKDTEKDLNNKWYQLVMKSMDQLR